MTEPNWTELSKTLTEQFGEDISEQTLLELVEYLAKGVTVVNPLHWCRQRARQRKLDLVRQEIREREGKAAMTAFQTMYKERDGRKDKAKHKRYNKKRKKGAA